eukprot:COSAG02_NODE_11631_length_1686_cov_6.427851_2_plen_66_part_00
MVIRGIPAHSEGILGGSRTFTNGALSINQRVSTGQKIELRISQLTGSQALSLWIFSADHMKSVSI